MEKDELLDIMDKTEIKRYAGAQHDAPGQNHVGARRCLALFLSLPDLIGQSRNPWIPRSSRGMTAFCAMLFFSSLLLLSSCSLPKIIILDDTLSPEEHLNLGVTYEKKGEYDPAIAEYEKASKKIPRAYVYLGNTYFEKGDLKKSEESYRKAIDRDPSLADAYNNLAWLYYTKKENLKEAESLASKAVELDPASENYRDTLKKIRELK